MITYASQAVRFLSTIVLCAMLFADVGYSQTAKNRIPDVHLEVTARQRLDGTLGSGFHVFDLFCWNQECSLSIITFDSCTLSGLSKPTSMMKEERWSTADGTLEVRPSENTLQVNLKTFDFGGESSTSLRFGYAQKGRDVLVRRLTSFSGGFVKNSDVLKRVLNVEYVPLTGTVGGFAEVDLGCPLLVPAL